MQHHLMLRGTANDASLSGGMESEQVNEKRKTSVSYWHTLPFTQTIITFRITTNHQHTTHQTTIYQHTSRQRKERTPSTCWNNSDGGSKENLRYDDKKKNIMTKVRGWGYQSEIITNQNKWWWWEAVMLRMMEDKWWANINVGIKSMNKDPSCCTRWLIHMIILKRSILHSCGTNRYDNNMVWLTSNASWDGCIHSTDRKGDSESKRDRSYETRHTKYIQQERWTRGRWWDEDQSTSSG